MLLVCPSCSSAFRIPPAAITAAGRAVRCSHCQHVWTAVPHDLVPEPDFEAAEAGNSPGRTGVSASADESWESESWESESWEPDTAEPETSEPETWEPEAWATEALAAGARAGDPAPDPRFRIGVDDDIIAVDRPFGTEEVVIAEADAPPLAPPAVDAAFDDEATPTAPKRADGSAGDTGDAGGSLAVAAREASSLDGLSLDGRLSDGRLADGEAERTARPRRRAAPAKPGLLALALRAVSAALLVAAAVLFIWRSDLVRLVPSLAGFYHLFGLEVNLRGLQLHEVRAVREAKDGIPILTIEGFVFNPGPKAAEVPKLRMAILGPAGRELYVWTAEPPQPMLKAGESFALRSRLASPPQDGQEVVVRFLHKRDFLQTRDLANSKP